VKGALPPDAAKGDNAVPGGRLGPLSAAWTVFDPEENPMNVSRATNVAWQAIAAMLLVVTLALPIAASGSAAAQTTALPKTAAAAPASTAVFHEIDLDPNGAQWQQLGAILGRLGLPSATDLLQNHMMEHGAARTNVTQADLDALLGGEVAIVISPAAIARMVEMQHEQAGAAAATPVANAVSGDHGMAAVLLPGDPGAAWDFIHRELTALAAKRNVSLDESTSNGADVIWVPPAQDGAAMQMDDHDGMGMHGMHANAGFAVAHADDYILAAPTRDDLTDIIDTIMSGSGSLADDADAQQVRGELPAEALSFTYVNGPAIVDAVDPQIIAEAANMNPGVAPEAWRVRSGVAFAADANGFRLDTIEIPGQGGNLQAAVPQNDTSAISAAAGRAPADTFAFEAGVLPQDAFVDAPFLLAEAVNHASHPDQTTNENQAAPTQAEMDAAIAQAAQTLGFDPRTELFDLLGGNFVVFTNLPDILHGDFVPDAVAAVDTSDPATLGTTTRKLATLIDLTQKDVDVATRQIGSDTVYAVSAVADATNQQIQIQIPAFDIGVIGGQLVAGLGNGIEQMVNAPASSLADEAQYKTVMGLLPSEHYQVNYVDLRQIVDPLAQAASMIETHVMPGGHSESSTPAMSSTGLQNLRALGSVSFRRGDMAGSSMIIYIPEPGS
jgi:hypothetical protein